MVPKQFDQSTGMPEDGAQKYPQDDRFELRRLEPSDAELRVRWAKDPRTTAMMYVPGDLDVEGTAQWILAVRDEGRENLVAVERETGIPRAMVGALGEDNLEFPELHVFVDPDRHGEGIGTAALRLLIEWLRNRPETYGCWLTVHPDNQAARAVYGKLGFKLAGKASSPDRVRMELLW